MASEKQIAANRKNALKGGVKIPAGKLAVRSNAVSHGIFSKDAVLPGEDSALLAELREKIMAEVKPSGELETILVERIISSTWRLKRALCSEQRYNRQAVIDVNNMEDYLRNIDYRYEGWQNYLKYEKAIEREIFKAMYELERLQMIRLGQNLSPSFPSGESQDIDAQAEDRVNAYNGIL
jgi:hypothetical protein